MTGKITSRTLRRSAFTSALLLSSAIGVQALAQETGGSEEVTVTAQRREQAIQKVPIAVTAIGAKELESKNIESFRDLQFNVPSVTYSKGNFSANNFQVRGIGLSSVATSGDTGVSIHQDDFYLLGSVGLATAEYFDLERLEVLRGPQSTLYGRNATGGAVNIITRKASADYLHGDLEATYGEYNTAKIKGAINIPLIENELAIRLSGIFAHHDGYVENLYTGNDVDSQNTYSLRGTVRWTPSDSTTIDLTAQYGFEKDSHVRYPKQLCHRDPTGVLGCLPDKLAFEAVNGDATLGNQQLALQNTLGLFGLHLLSLTDAVGGNANSPVPNDLLKIYSDFDPSFRGESQLYYGQIKQDLGDWLTVSFLGGYSKGETYSESHYNNLVGDDISTRLQTALATLQAIFPQSYARLLPLFINGTGELPIGGIEDNGLTGGNIRFTADNLIGYDRIEAQGEQQTYELKFQSNFDGPVNFLLAGFYLKAESNTAYYVNANSLDYAGMMLGEVVFGEAFGVRPLYTGLGVPTNIPLIAGPTRYSNDTQQYNLDSTAIFGEIYYDIIPDELKLTAGLRWTQDEKRTVARQMLFNVVVPYGTIDMAPWLAGGPVFVPPENVPFYDANPSTPEADTLAILEGKFEKLTGRLVLDWTPDLDWTDSTLVYASYARGFKSGGINPPLQSGTSVPATFRPETINAFEIGTKNTWLFEDGGLFQANLTAWYYDYSGYQVSKIVERTSVNENVDATLWGVEGEFLYRPNDRWTFNLNATHTKTKLGEFASIDQRNPGAGLSNAVVIKASNGSNCVIMMGPAAGGLTPAQAGVPGFFEPYGGAQSIAQYGVPHVNFGLCPTKAGVPVLPAGYSYTDNPSGIPVQLEGNELPQTPQNTISLGAQYATPIGDDGYELVLRADWYWQSSMWTRIYNGPADKVESWSVLNLSVQLNAPGDAWYAKIFATNVLDERGITNSYLTDASSGLFTNVFVQDPRVIGITLGVNFGAPEAAAPEPPPPPPPPVAAKSFIVFFDFDRSDLTPEAQAVIAEAAAVFQSTGAVSISVVGHTDTVGSAAYNLPLSQRRAASVKTALVANGVSGDAVSTDGRGFSEPLVPTGPGVKEPQNRRATIDLTGSGT